MALLTFTIIGPVVAVCLLLAYVGRKCIAYKRLAHFGGPPLAGWSHLWLARQVFNSRTPYAQAEVLDKYGSPARIAPNILVTHDPELLRHMSGARAGWTKSSWYAAAKFDPRINSIFSETDEKLHSGLRAIEIGAYTMRDVDTVEDDIDENLINLLGLLRREYCDKRCDLAAISAWFTLDVLSKIAFGERFGFLDVNEDLFKYNTLNRAFFGPLEMILSLPVLRWIVSFRWVQDAITPKPTDKEGQGAAHGFAEKLIAARFAPDAKGVEKRDMLGHFIRKGLTQVQAESEARLQLFAGSDSTSAALRNTLVSIISNPRVYNRLREEIDHASSEGQLSYPIVRDSEAAKLEYLQACIWEGLRMYPPLFGLLSKVAPAGGDTLNGQYFPPGTEVAICYHALCRRKDVFGPDVEVFRPERWLNASAEDKIKMLRTTELIFGSGKYGCLGKNIGFVEQNKCLVEFMRTFDWALADPLRGSVFIAAGLWVQHDLNVYITPRQTEGIGTHPIIA